MSETLQHAAQLLADSACTVALTGAGVSVASGIPDFRSEGGIWERFDPNVYATLSAFKKDPASTWQFFRALRATCQNAAPNRAHLALARLEALGLLREVLTQNIDGLHQAAGSSVLPLHGRGDRVRCIACDRSDDWPEIDASDVDGSLDGSLGGAGDGAQDSVTVPMCSGCGAPLKVDAILFEEALRPEVLRRAQMLAASCSVMLIVGTSAEVFPAADLPRIALQAGATLIEVNLEPTHLSAHAICITGRAEVVVPALVAEAMRLGSQES